MDNFKDKEHDIDSCKDVWKEFYYIVYPKYFGEYFDFSNLEDKETSPKCKRWYIKLKRDIDISHTFPKFKMAGDCIFNFNDKKIDKLNKLPLSDKAKKLLDKCAKKHHSFENFAFMPITGGMNIQ